VFLEALAHAVGPTGRVVGIDQSQPFLARAANRISESGLERRVEVRSGDALHLPFADASFDAAHCERVLMHVEDPDEAVREMVRVVRPGGRVVAAEVYADAAAMDHPDRDLMRRVSAALVSGIHNADVGITLRRRFLEGGLVDVSGEVVGFVEESLDQDEAEEVEGLAREFARRGEIEASRAEAFIGELERRRTAGTYTGMAIIIVVGGTVPVAG
jgi:SAM-dependent methyltransferase